MKYTNQYNLSLSVAAWLANDDYDYNNDPKTLSTTTLLKSVRQIVLAKRAIKAGLVLTTDVSTRISSSLGTAVHDSLEKVWDDHNYEKPLRSLGYSQKDIDRIMVNPNPEHVSENKIAIYTENRTEKKINDYTITGKYDHVYNGQLQDFKTTGVYSYIKQTNTTKFMQQGSIYRWLNPNIITNDEMLIQYIFFNWEAFKVNQEGYPAFKILAQPLTLMSYEETEQFIIDKLALIDKYLDVQESELPLCTSEDLWQNPSVYSYYKNPAKMTRATKNFPTYYEAQNRYIQDGSVGTIVEKPAQIKACAFCPSFELCSQKDTYITNGTLVS